MFSSVEALLEVCLSPRNCYVYSLSNYTSFDYHDNNLCCFSPEVMDLYSVKWELWISHYSLINACQRCVYWCCGLRRLLLRLFLLFFGWPGPVLPHLVLPSLHWHELCTRLLPDGQNSIISWTCRLWERPQEFRVPFGTGP